MTTMLFFLVIPPSDAAEKAIPVRKIRQKEKMSMETKQPLKDRLAVRLGQKAEVAENIFEGIGGIEILLVLQNRNNIASSDMTKVVGTADQQNADMERLKLTDVPASIKASIKNTGGSRSGQSAKNDNDDNVAVLAPTSCSSGFEWHSQAVPGLRYRPRMPVPV